uniref:Serine/threonine-protein phosphatase n=1 Tax=Macrostomum lignano TaxID=282301 RepID=A0A1I8GL05_9PLAT
PPLQSDSNAGNSDPPETVAGLFSRLHNAGLQQRCLPSDFTVQLIAGALATAKSVLLAEPNCLQLAGPIVMFGDLHGEFHSLVKLIEVLGRPPARSYLFLGDYVDRGPLSLETVLRCIPRHVFVLRGNHEDRRIYRYFNFEDELIATFGLTAGQNLSNYFNETFCYLPVCAVVNGEIFCCHGGLSPYFNHPRFAASQAELVRRINEPSKPLHFRKSDFIADLLWSDALDIGVVEWMPNPRGCSYVFTKAACFNFLRRHRLNWLIRAHMFVMNGCKFSFEGRCVTLFSAADYAQRYRNTGAVLHIPGSASDGTKFPGRTLRFCKKNLLQCDSRLPENPADWPEEIAVKKSLIR